MTLQKKIDGTALDRRRPPASSESRSAGRVSGPSFGRTRSGAAQESGQYGTVTGGDSQMTGNRWRANQGGNRSAVPGAAIDDCAQRQSHWPAFAASCDQSMRSQWPSSCATTQNSRSIMLSNVTGVDWLDKEISEKVKVSSGQKDRGRRGERSGGDVEETRKHVSRAILKRSITFIPWRRSMGRSIIRMRTENRTDQVKSAVAHAGLAVGRISGARDFRPLRHYFRRATPICGGILMWDGSRTTRCARITSSPTITNTSPPRTIKCSKATGHKSAVARRGG